MTSKPCGGADVLARSLVGLPAPHDCVATRSRRTVRSVISQGWLDGGSPPPARLDRRRPGGWSLHRRVRDHLLAVPRRSQGCITPVPRGARLSSYPDALARRVVHWAQ